ncbi:hypothetical protein [Ileibacterium valens]|uniref:hypothetical protein n=1 Tax=Ileibacterium valens TaxID=1862668 RepID=UPI00272AC2C0|nr:hypothetical protein [Ileibacterium valens]
MKQDTLCQTEQEKKHQKESYERMVDQPDGEYKADYDAYSRPQRADEVRGECEKEFPRDADEIKG